MEKKPPYDIIYPLSTLTDTNFYDYILNVNQIISSNIKDFPSCYLLSQSDVNLFRAMTFYFTNFYKTNYITYICNDFLFYKKKEILSQQHKKFLVKMFIMLFTGSYYLIDAFKVNYSLISLLIYKLLKKFYYDGFIEGSEIALIVKFRIVTAFFDKDILNDRDCVCRKSKRIKNLIPLWSSLKFLTSFCGIDIYEHNNLKLDSTIIEILKFIDEFSLSNFNNITMLVNTKKIIQILDLAAIHESIVQYTTKILSKIFKENFNLNLLLNSMNDIFFNDNYNNNFNKEQNFVLKAKTKILASQIDFLRELFKEEDQMSFASNQIQIPNGFYFNNNPLSGIVTEPISFQNEGYGIVISFNYMPETAKSTNNFTIFSFFSNEILAQLYIKNEKLYLNYPNKNIEICDIVPFTNYVVWIFHKNHILISSKSQMVINVNGREFIFNDISYIKEKEFLISIGATPDLLSLNVSLMTVFQEKKNNILNKDCFVGAIGTFILFDHDFFKDFLKNRESKKKDNLIDLKGYYENIIYIYDKNYCNNEEQFENLHRLIGNDLLKYICVNISSRSVNKFKQFKNDKCLLGFSTNYYGERQDLTTNKIKFYTQCYPDVSSFVCYPFTKRNSLPNFIGENGIKFLHSHLFFYYNNLERSKNFSFIGSDEINSNLEKLVTLFLYCIEKKGIDRMTKEQIEEVENFLHGIRILFERNKENNFMKINLQFLLPFSQYLPFLIKNDLFFKHCDFLLEYDYYDKRDGSVFEFLLSNIKIILKDNYDKCLIEEFFIKILNFDALYLIPLFSDAMKSYSTLLRDFLQLFFEKEKKNLLLIYINKIYSFKLGSFDEKESKYSSHEKILLMYKYLKNLYLAMYNDDTTKKIVSIAIESNFYHELLSFFNSTVDSIENEFREKLTTAIDETDDIKYSELIKSLCIRFINELIYNSETEPIAKSRSNYNFNQISDERKSLYSNPFSSFTTNNLLRVNQQLSKQEKEEEIISCFSFFDSLTVTPITFRSFFLMPFRALTHREKLIFIKNKNFNTKVPLLDIKHYEKSKFYLRVVVRLIEKIADEDQPTTIYCENFQLIEYAYDLFYNLLNQMIEHFLNCSDERYKSEIKPMIKQIFTHQKICPKLFFSILDSKLLSFGEIIQDSQRMTTNETTKEEKQKIISKIHSNIFELIDKTMFTLRDPFFFKFLQTLYTKEKNDDHSEFVLNAIAHIIDNFNNISKFKSKLKKEEELNRVDNISEINGANLLILIYQITFFQKKQSKLIQNEIFLKQIVPFLSIYPLKNKLLFLKISFSIEETFSLPHKPTVQKFLLEILFEIYFEIYNESFSQNKRESYNSITSSQNDNEAEMCESLICELLVNKEILIKAFEQKSKNAARNSISTEKSEKGKKEKGKKEKGTICYAIDKLAIRRRKSNLIKLSQFESETNDLLYWINRKYQITEADVSLTVFFLTKILIHAKKIETEHGETSLSIFLLKTAKQLCKDAKVIYHKYLSVDPLRGIDEYNNKLYNQIKQFIEQKFIIDDDPKNQFSKEQLYKILDLYPREQKKYRCVLFSSNGKIDSNNKLLTKVESNHLLRSTNSLANISANEYSYSEKKSESLQFREIKKINSTSLFLFRPSYNNKSLCDLHSKSSMVLPAGEIKRKKLKEKKIVDKADKVIKRIFSFKKDFVKKTFSLFFMRFLNCNEDFVKIKKLYNYHYKDEIKNINEYNDIKYPTRMKNYTTSNYSKVFLTYDTNFFNNELLQYTHKFLKANFNFVPPIRKYFYKINYYDYNKEKFPESEDKVYKTELITTEGAIYGKIFIFDNCFVFKSEKKEDDERVTKSNLDFVCSSIESDFLYKDKEIIIFYDEISEVLNRRFLFTWLAIEFILKNGKNYFFNLFTKSQHKKLFSFLSTKKEKFTIVENPKDFFKKKEFTKKWLKKEISTYDYILLLNKFSSRSYNDVNQYLIMPWLQTKNQSYRQFDLPISLQTEKRQREFLSNSIELSDDHRRHHGNHYSTSAYVCYYLMRTNPFTHNMVRFQSNRFDEPDRQFVRIINTLYICENFKDNRELIPEIYSTPECFVNLNCNDFGKQASPDYERVHNVTFTPFGENVVDFCYRMKNLLNFDENVNENIHKWFEYVFGTKQELEEGKANGFTNFQTYCYAQEINFEQMRSNLEKEKNSEKEIIKQLKNTVNLVINLGQTPYQLLDDTFANMKRKITNEKNNNVITGKQISFSKNDIIIDFTKSVDGDSIYFITKTKNILIYNNTTLNIDAPFLPRSNFRFFSKIKGSTFPIYKPKFLFCELSKRKFIFCRYLDNTIKYFIHSKTNSTLPTKIVVDSFVTCVIRINANEFLTGHQNGKVTHWFIDTGELVEIKILKSLYANENSIMAMMYSEKLNLVATADSCNVTLRNEFSFEYLCNIHIERKYKKINIVDVKISNCDLVYVLYNIGDTEQHVLCGYTLNGIYFGEVQGAIANFEFTKQGKILCSYYHDCKIDVIDPVNFSVVYSKENFGFSCGLIDENTLMFSFDEEKMWIDVVYAKEEKWNFIREEISKEEWDYFK